MDFRPLFVFDAHTCHEIVVNVSADLRNFLQGIVSVQRVPGDVWSYREGGGSVVVSSKLPDLFVDLDLLSNCLEFHSHVWWTGTFVVLAL